MRTANPLSGGPHGVLRSVATCAASLWLTLLTALAVPLRAEEESPGLFISVPNPLTSDGYERVTKITERALERHRNAVGNPARAPLTLVYDFNPDGRASATDKYGPCSDLARYLLGLHDATTVAFVHHDVTGHAVLPVLACKELVMASEARLGDVAREGRVDEDQRQFYREVARKRSRPEAVVLKLLDRDLVLLEGRKRGSVTYLDGRQVAEAEKEGVVVTRQEPVVPAGQGTTLFARGQAQKFGLAVLRGETESRQQVAQSYGLPASSLHENPLLGRNPVAWRLELTGSVDGAFGEALKRHVGSAVSHRDAPANLIVLELRCAGGDLQTAKELADYLRDLKDAEGRTPVMTVAYVPERADAAATVLAFGCHEIVLGEKAKFGDFQSVVAELKEGKWVDLDPERYALVRDVVVTLATKQGYAPALVQGMFDRNEVVSKVVSRRGPREWAYLTEKEFRDDQALPEPRWANQPQVVKKKGELLVLDAESAKQHGIARHVVADLPGLYAQYGAVPERVRETGPDWLDALASFLRLPFVAVVLVMAGITFLILELKMPGVSLPGILSALCFILFFWAHSFGGQVTVLAILLFILGLALLGLEIFVLPGFGLPGIAGLVLVFGSLGLMAYGHWPRNSVEWGDFFKSVAPFGFSLVGALVAVLVVARYLPHIPYANRLVLRSAPEGTDLPGDDLPGRPDLSALLGAMGVAATPLRPAGKAQFGETYVDVVSEASYVHPGSRVQVIEIEGNRVVVKEVI